MSLDSSQPKFYWPSQIQNLDMGFILSVDALLNNKGEVDADFPSIFYQYTSQLAQQYNCSINRVQSELAAEVQQFLQQFQEEQPANHYGQSQERYLTEAQALPEELKQEGNFALLVGCLTQRSAEEFIATVKEISPHLKPIIIDLRGFGVPILAQSSDALYFSFADAEHLPFASGSIALIHSHYLFSTLLTDSEESAAMLDILLECYRVQHPRGISTHVDIAEVEELDRRVKKFTSET